MGKELYFIATLNIFICMSRLNEATISLASFAHYLFMNRECRAVRRGRTSSVPTSRHCDPHVQRSKASLKARVTINSNITPG
jgi:hypothetical protein